VRKSAVLYQLCHFSSKRFEEKWHNWYSTALFIYTSNPTDSVGVDLVGLLFGQERGHTRPQCPSVFSCLYE